MLIKKFISLDDLTFILIREHLRLLFSQKIMWSTTTWILEFVRFFSRNCPECCIYISLPNVMWFMLRSSFGRNSQSHCSVNTWSLTFFGSIEYICRSFNTFQYISVYCLKANVDASARRHKTKLDFALH